MRPRERAASLRSAGSSRSRHSTSAVTPSGLSQEPSTRAASRAASVRMSNLWRRVMAAPSSARSRYSRSPDSSSSVASIPDAATGEEVSAPSAMLEPRAMASRVEVGRHGAGPAALPSSGVAGGEREEDGTPEAPPSPGTVVSSVSGRRRSVSMTTARALEAVGSSAEASFIRVFSVSRRMGCSGSSMWGISASMSGSSGSDIEPSARMAC